MSIFHCDNTAEAAYILITKPQYVEFVGFDPLPDSGHVDIILKESEPGHIGECLANYPLSPYFKFFGMLHWLNLGIRNLKKEKITCQL